MSVKNRGCGLNLQTEFAECELREYRVRVQRDGGLRATYIIEAKSSKEAEDRVKKIWDKDMVGVLTSIPVTWRGGEGHD